MKKPFCDLCGKEIIGHGGTIELNSDEYVFYEDVHPECVEKVIKVIAELINEVKDD